MIESTAEVYGKPPLIYPMDPSSGPVGAVCGVSEPPTAVASFGTSYAGSSPHGPNENIRVDDFLKTIKLIGRVIHKLAGSKAKSEAELPEDKKPTAPLPKLKHADKKE